MLVATSLALAIAAQSPTVGPTLTPSFQILQPAGRTLLLPGGRPVTISLSKDGRTLYVKDLNRLRAIDTATWSQISEGRSPGGASLWGLASSEKGIETYFTDSHTGLLEFGNDVTGGLKLERTLALPGTNGSGDSFPCGVAVFGSTAYVCLSRNNTLGVVDLLEGKLTAQIPVGIAPYEVSLSKDGATAYVSNQGGSAPAAGQDSAPSAGTPTAVDKRGVALNGTVSVVNLASRTQTAAVTVGRQPTSMIGLPRANLLLCSNTNSDSVSWIDTRTNTVKFSLKIEPDPNMPFGSMPDAMALSPDYKKLFVALAGDNAVAVIGNPAGFPKILGYIPTGWYPTSLQVLGNTLFIANNKGLGSRSRPRSEDKGWSTYDYAGTLQKVLIPGDAALALMTHQVLVGLHRSEMLSAMVPVARKSVARPVAIPQRVGDPSLIHHVVYVIRENRTYDQVLGDLPQGNGSAALCTFGAKFTPNAHRLVQQFTLLDNYYCNGVLSADGHSWATEGNVTPYLDRAFGGFSRSYTFGDDPLTYSSTGFVWDRILDAGLSFRNFGEMDYASVTGDLKIRQVMGLRSVGARVAITHNIGIARLRRESDPDYPGWGLNIPDQLRMDIFQRKFLGFKQANSMPNFTIVYLPQDHTGGELSPASYVADNDLALGRLVQLISHSQFWKDTAIFVEEDDPQNGFDHVDGHRSPCLVISPYSRHGAVVHDFYNQTSVLRTMLAIFGLPPLNQRDAASPLMSECFTTRPNFEPYMAVPNLVSLSMPPRASHASAPKLAKRLLAEVRRLPLREREVQSNSDDDLLNRFIWQEMKGYRAKYPSRFVSGD